MFSLTLLANADKVPLTQAFVDSMTPSLALQGANVVSHEWLKPGAACRLTLTNNGQPTINSLFADQPYDAILEPHPRPTYKLLISDMDSTMITVECIDELADFVGKKDEVSRITERAMNGELDFEQALRERVVLLAGLPESVLQECYDDRVKPMNGANDLIKAAKAKGIYTLLVSGGFTFFTARVAKDIGFDGHVGNILDVKNGQLTGYVIPPILGKEAKLASLKNTAQKLGISPRPANE